MKRLRLVLIIGVLLVAGAAYYRFQLGQSTDSGPGDSQAVEVEDLMVVERGDIVLSISASGAIQPNARLGLFFSLPGTVAEVLVEAGDAVQAGDVLARLEETDLQFAVQDAGIALNLQQVAFDALTSPARSVDIAAAQAAVNAAYAQLVLSQEPPGERNTRIAILQQELARNQLWQAQIQRDQTVLADGAGFSNGLQVAQAESSVGRADYDVQIAALQVQQQRNMTISEVNVANAQAALANAQAGLSQLLDGPSENDIALAEAQLQSAYLAVALARHQLEQTIITAHFDGIITRQNLTVGEAPPVNAPAMELVDQSSFYIDLLVDEIDIAQVAIDQAAQVVLDALPGEQISGRVTRIADVGFDLGGVITYTVRVILDQTPLPIRVGMSATATLIVEELRDVLRVRNRFVRLDRRTQQAFVVVRRGDGTVEEIEVRLGQRNDTFSTVLEGLAEGDEVVLLPRTVFEALGFGSFAP